MADRVFISSPRVVESLQGPGIGTAHHKTVASREL